MATAQCERPIEKTSHETSREQQLSSGQTKVQKETVQAETKSVSQTNGHDMTKTHAESKTQSHGVPAQQHAALGVGMTSHGKKEKIIKEKKEKEKKQKKEKKEKKTENKKKPEKEKSKHKKGKDSSDSD